MGKLAYGLGETMGELIAARCSLAELRFEDERNDANKRIMYFVEKDITFAVTSMAQRILPGIINENELEEFYKGVTKVLVVTRTPLSDILGILPDLPGNPQLRQVWKFSLEELQKGEVFHDKITNKYLRAENEKGLMFIRLFISSLSSQRNSRPEKRSEDTE